MPIYPAEMIERLHEQALRNAREPEFDDMPRGPRRECWTDGDRWIVDRLRDKGLERRTSDRETHLGVNGFSITVVFGACLETELDDVCCFGLECMGRDAKPAAVIRRMRWHLSRLVDRGALETRIETQSPGDILGWRLPTRFRAWYFAGWHDYLRATELARRASLAPILTPGLAPSPR